jgi:hypothetical protein
LIEELCREEEGIMFAEKILAKESRDYDKFARNMAIMKNSMDRASAIYDGKVAANLEIARKMKAAGRPSGEIAEFTGLSTETIADL